MYKWILSCTIAVLLLTVVVGQPGVLASPLKDLQKEKRLNEQKLNNINTNINKKKSEITVNKSNIDRIMDKIRTLNGKINETNSNIDQVRAKINQTTKEIKDLRVSIADLEKKIEERDEVLRDRVLAMQVQGGEVNYIDVLLGANSFADFIDRFSAVNTLMDADRKIMQQQADDKEQLEKEKALVEKKLAEQEASKEKLEGLKASLVSQKQELNKLIDELEAEQAKLLKEKKSLEGEFHAAHEVGKELTAKIAAEQKRAAEAARKAEEERKRKAAAAAAARHHRHHQVAEVLLHRLSQAEHGQSQHRELTHPHLDGGRTRFTERKDSIAGRISPTRPVPRSMLQGMASFHMQVRWVPMGMSS